MKLIIAILREVFEALTRAVDKFKFNVNVDILDTLVLEENKYAVEQVQESREDEIKN